MKPKNQQAIVAIITNNCFHQAIVLGHSLQQFENKSDFILFVIGYDETNPDYQKAGFTIRDAKTLVSEKWKHFVFQYDALQAACALKPIAMLHLLERYKKVIYLDTDMKFFQSLEEAWQQLDSSDLSLTPHSYTTIKDDGFGPPRVTMRLSGLFNAGYVGATRTGIKFLEWWWDQTKHNCIIVHERGIFLDQAYLNDAAYMVHRLSILRNESYNVACWNLHERALKKEGSRYLVNGKPLTFFHFSGYAELIEVRPPPSGKEIFEELYRKYKKEVQGEKKKVLLKEYPFQHFQDGMKISALWRDWMRRGIPELEKEEDPFSIVLSRREEIEIIMKQRAEDYRPKLDREVYMTPELRASLEQES